MMSPLISAYLSIRHAIVQLQLMVEARSLPVSVSVPVTVSVPLRSTTNNKLAHINHASLKGRKQQQTSNQLIVIDSSDSDGNNDDGYNINYSSRHVSMSEDATTGTGSSISCNLIQCNLLCSR
jgi:hypothetical protein